MHTNDLVISLHFFSQNKLNITNDNLIGIKILDLNVEVLHMSVVVGTLNLKEDGTVGSRVTNKVNVSTTVNPIQDYIKRIFISNLLY